MAGRVLSDRYELEDRLGTGGMGEVWAAHDHVIRRRVAVKLLHPQRDGDDAAELFFREARTAGGLNHPGVVTIYDIGRSTDGTLFLVMELLAGRDLGKVLRQEGPPEISVALDWATQVADALAVAHLAGVVHRDLKPANLMLTPSGTVKILDFGIARYVSTVTRASRIIGTPDYMPPERLEGKAGDGRADLYSLGCLLHELLTGRTPFAGLDAAALMFAHVGREAEPPSTHRPEVPAGLDRLVTDLLAKDPAHRPPTAGDVGDRLRALAAVHRIPTVAAPAGGDPRVGWPEPGTAGAEPGAAPGGERPDGEIGRGVVVVAAPDGPGELPDTFPDTSPDPVPGERQPVPADAAGAVLPMMSGRRALSNVLVLLGLPAATVWIASGFVYACRADPGPAVWKLLAYGAGSLTALAATLLVLFGTYVLRTADWREPDWVLNVGMPVIFLGVPAALVASLVHPALFGPLGTSGAWVPDLLGLI